MTVKEEFVSLLISTGQRMMAMVYARRPSRMPEPLDKLWLPEGMQLRVALRADLWTGLPEGMVDWKKAGEERSCFFEVTKWGIYSPFGQMTGLFLQKKTVVSEKKCIFA